MTTCTILKSAAAVLLAATMAFAQPKPKSQAEVDAIMAIQNAAEPERPDRSGREPSARSSRTRSSSPSLCMVAAALLSRPMTTKRW